MLYNALGVMNVKEIGEGKLSDKQKKILTAVLIVAVIIFSFVIAILVGKPLIQFVNKPEQFRGFVKSYGILSDIVFILMIIFQTVIAIVPGEPFEIAAGYAFGAVRGTVDCLIAFLIAGVIIFLTVRKFGVRVVEVFFPIEKIKRLKFLQDSKRVNILCFIIFLIPGTPKDLLSYFVGLTDMKLSAWIFITTVARIPSLITSVLAGTALGNERYEIAIIVFSVTVILSGIGLIIYKRIGKAYTR